MSESEETFPTRQCRSCFSEIDERCRKCPHCQAFQKFYANPQWFALLAFVPLILVMMSTGLFLPDREFAAHSGEFTVEFVSEETSEKNSFPGGTCHVTFRITNASAHEWRKLRFQVIGCGEDGEPVVTRTNTEYGWTIPPGASRLITGEAPGLPSVVRWDLQILDLDSGPLL